MKRTSQDIKAIFADALEKKTDQERTAYLDQVCRNNEALRQKVEALLQAYEKSSLVPDTPVIGSDELLEKRPLTEVPGTVIGRYRLLEKIGEGGMAVVYMAEQEQPIRRKVALKIIKLGMDTQQVIARFEAERQALALMDHPNIAKVFDAGATETGRPYFVMELVRGSSVTEYCDQNNLSTKDRLALFIQVCNAVQHAHQKGIIHRDIKPTNVLVTQRDGEPVPKVIDFGIAKATNRRLTEKTLFTRYAHIIGTPAYMSPEQAELSEFDVDTRSDVYSLGVLLYELLTGATPFSEEELRKAGYMEMARVIREDEPAKPSTKLGTLGKPLTDIAKHRNVSPDVLKRAMRGDLDWIVMKSLEKDRTRRYETTHDLAEDLMHHLNDEPVLAGPPNRGYRLKKFIKKHRIPVFAAMACATAISAGLVLSQIFYRKARISEKEARFQAHMADTEKLRAEDQKLMAQRYFYAANMRLAGNEFDSADTRPTLDCLKAHIPENEQEDSRGFEWYYLWALCHNDSLTIKGGARCISYAPDSKSLAVGGFSNTIRILDASTGQTLKTLPVDGEDVLAVSFSHNGASLSARGPGWVRTWSIPDYEEVLTSRNTPFLNPSSSQELSTTPSNSSIEFFENLVADVKKGTMSFLSSSDIGEKTLLDAPDGRFLAVGASDGWIMGLDPGTGQEHVRFKAHDRQVESIAFSRDGQTLFSLGGRKQSSFLTNAVSSSDHFDRRIRAVRFGSLEMREFKEWDMSQVDSPRLLSSKSFLGARAMSSNGRLVACCGGRPLRDRVVLWDTATRKQLWSKELPEYMELCLFWPKSQAVAAVLSNARIHLYEAATGRMLKNLEAHMQRILSVSIAPNCRTMASCTAEEIKIWDLSKVMNPTRVDAPMFSTWWKEASHEFFGQHDGSGFRFSVKGGGCINVLTDATRLSARPGSPVTLTIDGIPSSTHSVWWIADVKTHDSLMGAVPPRYPQWMSFSPDGKLLAVATEEGTVLLWDVKRERKESTLKLSTLKSSGQIVSSEAFSTNIPPASTECSWGPFDFSPDGKLLILVNNCDEGLVFDLDTRRTLHHFKLQHTLRSLAISPDSEIAAFAGSETVSLWKLKTGEKAATIDIISLENTLKSIRDRTGILSIVFSPNGKTLAIGCSDGKIRLWDMVANMEKFTLTQPEGPVDFLAFISDGRSLISGHGDVTYLWYGSQGDVP